MYSTVIFLLAFTLSISVQYIQFVKPIPSSLLTVSTVLIEESSRFLILTEFIIPSKNFPTKYNQLQFAMISGVIFALLESAGYILHLSTSAFIMRLLIITPLHIFLTMLQVQLKKRGFLLAIALHTIYNYSYDIGSPLTQIMQIVILSSWFWIIGWLHIAKPKPFNPFD
ncbi:hypothetical protein PVA45_05670 [Entomospira entomophila]|uniref:Uncharacterized protein n=1 Tax=Entomospira entomophila TaxID=2719988 RepID=A0A968GAE3_9SPIO|nr:hypothetical protein [Entomospira entomophilus]NIZ40986.1 hypothetical protein [Entomospira entomophilus]WDI35199.1 hypothetical protein PVA45_05670 [Entomospira entomophilus]